MRLKNICRAELDAYCARLYGLTRDELRYTPFSVDLKKVHGDDFPGEPVRVLKEKEIKQFWGYSPALARRCKCRAG